MIKGPDEGKVIAQRPHQTPEEAARIRDKRIESIIARITKSCPPAWSTSPEYKAVKMGYEEAHNPDQLAELEEVLLKTPANWDSEGPAGWLALADYVRERRALEEKKLG